jgi:hypothetical protein
MIASTIRGVQIMKSNEDTESNNFYRSDDDEESYKDIENDEDIECTNPEHQVAN